MENRKPLPKICAMTAKVFAVLAIVLMFTMCAQQTKKEQLKASIEKANGEWMQAVKNRDAAAVAGMYAEDGFVMPPNSPAIQGREGIKGFFSGAMDAGVKDVRLVTEDVEGDDNFAIEKGTYEMRAEGDVVIDQGKYLVHWKKMDGKWRFKNDMFSSNHPAAAPTFKKGNVVGLHVGQIKLQPGVTIDQFAQHYRESVIPEFEKTYPDVKLYLIRGIRGENKNGIGLIYFFESDDIRNKYFNPDETPTEAGKVLNAKMQPTYDALAKLRASATTKYTDWVVE
jgi:uncharacterized protein (TIGR02246 family)